MRALPIAPNLAVDEGEFLWLPGQHLIIDEVELEGASRVFHCSIITPDTVSPGVANDVGKDPHTHTHAHTHTLTHAHALTHSLAHSLTQSPTQCLPHAHSCTDINWLLHQIGLGALEVSAVSLDL